MSKSQSPLIGSVFQIKDAAAGEMNKLPSQSPLIGSVFQMYWSVHIQSRSIHVSIPSNRVSLSDKMILILLLISIKSQSPLIGSVFQITEGAITTDWQSSVSIPSNRVSLSDEALKQYIGVKIVVSIPSNRVSLSDPIIPMSISKKAQSQSPLIGSVFQMWYNIDRITRNYSVSIPSNRVSLSDWSIRCQLLCPVRVNYLGRFFCLKMIFERVDFDCFMPLITMPHSVKAMLSFGHH